MEHAAVRYFARTPACGDITTAELADVQVLDTRAMDFLISINLIVIYKSLICWQHNYWNFQYSMNIKWKFHFALYLLLSQLFIDKIFIIWKSQLLPIFE